jgi:hypothetical protein
MWMSPNLALATSQPRNGALNSFQVNWGEMVVNLPNKLISRPSVIAIPIGEVERANKMTVEGDFSSFNLRVMTVNLHHGMVTRNWKHEDLSMKFLCSWDISKLLVGRFFFSIKLKDRINCYTGAVSILPLRNIQSVLAALEISGHKIGVYIVGLTFTSHNSKGK